jgi:glucokinase
VIGIDAGGTKLLGGVVDEQIVVHHRVHRTWRGADRQETLAIFTDAVEEVRAAAPDVEAIGFGIPAVVERDTGVSRWSNHLPLDDVPFRDLMSERLGLPVLVDNDGNASMLAEARHGAAAGTQHAVMVSLGTGIGGGLWLNGDVYRGATGVGAELGHVVLELHGPDCPGNCPGIGCFEALVSGNAIGRGGRARLRARAAARVGQGDRRRDRHRVGPRRRSARARHPGRDRRAARLRARRAG